MDSDQRILLIGLYISAALYLVFVFVAAVLAHHLCGIMAHAPQANS